MAHEIPKLIIDLGVPCPVCKIPGAVFKNGVICKCFQCAIQEMKSGKKMAIAHLPDFWMADRAILDLAGRLISAYKPEAANAKICYLFRKKHTKTNGAIKLGTCSKVSAQNRTLHGYDYVIILAWDMWMMLEELQREALLLHELCHVFKAGEDDAVWKIEPHNVEEFRKVIEVYGLWKPDLEAMAASIQKHAEENGGMKQISFAWGKQQGKGVDHAQTAH